MFSCHVAELIAAYVGTYQVASWVNTALPGVSAEVKDAFLPRNPMAGDVLQLDSMCFEATSGPLYQRAISLCRNPSERVVEFLLSYFNHQAPTSVFLG